MSLSRSELIDLAGGGVGDGVGKTMPALTKVRSRTLCLGSSTYMILAEQLLIIKKSLKFRQHWKTSISTFSKQGRHLTLEFRLIAGIGSKFKASQVEMQTFPKSPSPG